MIIYKTEKVEKQVFYKAICDRCKNEIIDDIELQEMYNIRFTGGYGSVFGDGNGISCDLCQHCLYELIKDFLF